MQGSEALELIDRIDEEGEDVVFEHLKQWDQGDGYTTIRNEPPITWNGYRSHSDRSYIMTWNPHHEIIALSRKLSKKEYDILMHN